MRIKEWVKEWVKSWQPGSVCSFCARGSKDSDLALFQQEDLLICADCLRSPMTFWALDSMYWEDRPEEIPPCQHCHKVVPPDQLEPAVTLSWYFCLECVMDRDVILYWKRINRRLWKRRAKELGFE